MASFTGNQTLDWGKTYQDLVLFAATSGDIGSIVLSEQANAAAFEYGIPDPPSGVPIPAAIPLFATGLGALGLLGWRRKRKLKAA